jgi:hypothetical protein
MYFSIDKCSDKKALQETAMISFPNSAPVTSPTSVSIYPPRKRPFISNPRFHFVILLEVNRLKIKKATDKICCK